MLPDFLGIGVQRAATTWLHECLKEHPEVYVPEAKELHFFSLEYHRGLDWYERFFPDDVAAKVVGEITPTYLTHPEAMQRIVQDCPEAKLFIVLRDPVARARSAYRLVRERLYPSLDFEQACAENGYLVRLSMYSEPLRFVFENFPRSNVRVFLYDEIEESPRDVVRWLYGYLGVNEDFVPSAVSHHFNQVLYPRTQAFVEKMGLGPFLKGLKESAFGQHVKKMHSSGSGRQNRSGSVSKEFERELRATFRADIEKVEKLIDRDLSAWY